MFECSDHGWFESDGWTAGAVPVDPCETTRYRAEPSIHRAFLGHALEVLLRAGLEDDHVFFKSPDADNNVHFTLSAGGDGGVLAQVGARYWTCTKCGKPPPTKPNEAILLELGFAPPDPQFDYVCCDFPPAAELLATVAEKVLREALGEPDDFGLSAIFSTPALAEAFYLGWTWRWDIGPIVQSST
jgi:hypothetical protein